jgi:hypothetical protein
MLNEGVVWAKLGADALLDHHPVALRVLLLTAIFLFGYLESATWGKGAVACATWFLGLGGGWPIEFSPNIFLITSHDENAPVL